MSGGAEKALLNHLWPGNVRELRYCIERAYVLTSGNLLDAQVLFDEGGPPAATETADERYISLSNYLQECERKYLLQDLTRHDWQMTLTARDIGISRKNLWERLRRLKLAVPARVLREEVSDGDPN